MPPILKTLVTSRRFWAAVALVTVPFLNEKFGWEMTSEQFAGAALGIISWITAESIRSSEGPKASA